MGHQGVNQTYHLIKYEYYWKSMNNDICKYINKCGLCKRERAGSQVYALQITDIPKRPFHKIVIDLNVSASCNQHILTIINHLKGWPEAFPIPGRKVDTIVCIFINHYLPIHMCPHFILSDNGTEFKNQLMDNVLQQLGIDCIFSAPYHPQSNGKTRFFANTLNLPLRNSVKNTQTTGTNKSTKY